MRYDINLLKNKISNLLLIWYFSIIGVGLIRLPTGTATEKIFCLLGLVTGFAFKIVIILIYWYIFMTRYIKVDNKINIIQLIMGILLVSLAYPYSLNFSFIEAFIILSIAIILKKDYHI